MSEYRFMNQLTEKEQIPTPAYVFDLDEMKEFAEKVKRCLTGKAEICYAMKANPFLIKSPSAPDKRALTQKGCCF